MKKEKGKKLFFIFMIAFLVITLASKNSFLYRFNDWWDANAFMSVGKSWIKGLIPYRDLFEQKGPILYLLYAISAGISNTSFIGVYILEIINLTITLIFASKIIDLFIKDDHYKYLGIILFGFSSVFLKTFGHGGSAEEFTMPLFMISLYYFLSYLNVKDYKISKKVIFLNGLIAGIVLWIKYSLLGFWFIFEASIFFIYVFQKKYKEAILSALIFLSGMLIATIPWIIYFGYNHALNDLFNVYFLVNMNAYGTNTNILLKIIIASALAIYNLLSNPVYLLLIFIPLVILNLKHIKVFNKISSIILSIAVLFTGIGTYIGGTSYFYYGYILTSFNIIGIILILHFMKQKRIKLNRKIIGITLIVFAVEYLMICDNSQYMFWHKNDYAQYRFKEIIAKEEKPTLLNYNCLDVGLYTTTGIIPKNYYFMKNNISRKKYPEMMDEQERYIKEEKPMFVVTKREEKFLNDDYEVVSKYTQKYENMTITYYLYHLKNTQ